MHCWWEYKAVAAAVENRMTKKLNIELQYDPEIPKKMKAGTPTDIGIPIFRQH